jgi:hypothetical protein
MTTPPNSYTPEMDIDSPADLLHEPFAEYRGPLPMSHDQWRKLTRALVEKALEQSAIEPSVNDTRKGVIEMLRIISQDSDKHFAIRATLYARLLCIESRSLEEIGKAFGFTRASISHTYRQIKALHPGVSNPADKPEDYCQRAAERRTGRMKMRDGTDRRHVARLFQRQPTTN